MSERFTLEEVEMPLFGGKFDGVWESLPIPFFSFMPMKYTAVSEEKPKKKEVYEIHWARDAEDGGRLYWFGVHKSKLPNITMAEIKKAYRKAGR